MNLRIDFSAFDEPIEQEIVIAVNNKETMTEFVGKVIRRFKVFEQLHNVVE